MRSVLVALACLAGACHFQHGVAGVAGDGGGGGDAVDAAATDSFDAPGDRDGDGIADNADNCPDVANPDQHDFDGDGHGDACDHCPHLASTIDPDGDGDGVGDDCDPRPTTAGDHIALFAGFYSPADITGWTQVDTWTVTGGELVQSDKNQQQPAIFPPMTYAHAYVETEMIVSALGNGGFVGIGACSGDKGTTQYYCCTMYAPSTFEPQEAWVGGSNTSMATWTGTFAAGSNVHVVVNPIGGTICTATQGATTLTSTATTIGPTDGQVVVFMDSAAAAFRYLFVVEIGT
ncbi:MAG: thrombospondin type 3 repeat-containing protein [Acidobacteriota bacterium]